VPVHWELKRNKYLLTEKKEVVGNNASDYTLLSLTLKGIIVRDMENPKGKFPAEFNTYKVVYPDDLVFCLFDIEETPRTIGRAHQKGMITGAYTVMKCGQEVSARYLSYYYLSLDYDKRLKPLYTGLRKVIQHDTFMSLKSPLPPHDEQDCIANFLDQKTVEIEEAIAKKQRLIELLKEQKTILINRAVTKGLTPDVPMRDSGVEWVGDMPKHWEVKKLKYFSDVQSGITLGKQYGGKNLSNYPYLRVANVQAGFFDLSEIAVLSVPTRVAEQYFVRAGDILITEGGDIDKLGRGMVWENQVGNCLHQNHIFAVRVQLELVSEYFISLALGSDYGRRYFTHTANKTTNLASTNKTKLGNFSVAIPPPQEQQEVLKYSNNVSEEYDGLIRSISSEIEKLFEFKKIAVSETVTGKIKL
jgi:type I restriction enzyme S subunit